MSDIITYKLGLDLDNKEALKKLADVDTRISEIEDGKILIDLVYNENRKDFQKKVKALADTDPKLGIQFQYDINKRAYLQAKDKLSDLESIQVGIDAKGAKGYITELKKEIKQLYNNGASNDVITAKVQKLIDITNSIDPSLLKETERAMREVFENVKGLRELKPQTIFDINNIQDMREEVNYFEEVLGRLKKDGAVDIVDKSTNKDLAILTEKVSILDDKIASITNQMKNMTGKEYATAAQSVDILNTSLQNVLSNIEKIKSVKPIDINRLMVHGGDFSYLGKKEYRPSDGASQIADQLRAGFGYAGSGVNFSRKLTEYMEGKKQYLIDLNKIKDLNQIEFSTKEEEEAFENIANKIHQWVMELSGAFSELSLKDYSNYYYDGVKLIDGTETAESIYKELLNVFPNASLTIDQFNNFVENAISKIKSWGKIQKDDRGYYQFSNQDKFSDHNIMKDLFSSMGYTGYTPIQGGKYDGTYYGAVIYDLKDILDKNQDALIKKFNSDVDYQDFITNLEENISNLNAKVTAQIQDTNSTIEGLKVLYDTIVNLFERIAAVVKTGNNTSEGIGESVESNINLIKEGLKAAADAQNSNSPSEDYRELGHDAGEGYALGLEDKTERVKNASSELIKAGFEAARKEVENNTSNTNKNKKSDESIKEDLKKINEKKEALKEQRSLLEEELALQDKVNYYDEQTAKAQTRKKKNESNEDYAKRQAEAQVEAQRNKVKELSESFNQEIALYGKLSKAYQEAEEGSEAQDRARYNFVQQLVVMRNKIAELKSYETESLRKEGLSADLIKVPQFSNLSLTKILNNFDDVLGSFATKVQIRVDNINTELKELGQIGRTASSSINESVEDIESQILDKILGTEKTKNTRGDKRQLTIPLRLQEDAAEKLKGEINAIIDSLNEDIKPVEVQVAFISKKKTAKMTELQEQLSEDLKNIDNKEIRNKISNTIANIEKQFGTSLHLNVEVAGGREAKKLISNLRKELQAELPKIYVEAEFSQKTLDAMAKQLEDINFEPIKITTKKVASGKDKNDQKVLEKEYAPLDVIRKAIEKITLAIGLKTKAFGEEAEAVEKYAGQEEGYLKPLLEAFIGIRDVLSEIKGLSGTLGDIHFNIDGDNLAKLVSAASVMSNTLPSITETVSSGAKKDNNNQSQVTEELKEQENISQKVTESIENQTKEVQALYKEFVKLRGVAHEYEALVEEFGPDYTEASLYREEFDNIFQSIYDRHKNINPNDFADVANMSDEELLAKVKEILGTTTKQKQETKEVKKQTLETKTAVEKMDEPLKKASKNAKSFAQSMEKAAKNSQLIYTTMGDKKVASPLSANAYSGLLRMSSNPKSDNQQAANDILKMVNDYVHSGSIDILDQMKDYVSSSNLSSKMKSSIAKSINGLIKSLGTQIEKTGDQAAKEEITPKKMKTIEMGKGEYKAWYKANSGFGDSSDFEYNFGKHLESLAKAGKAKQDITKNGKKGKWHIQVQVEDTGTEEVQQNLDKLEKKEEKVAEKAVKSSKKKIEVKREENKVTQETLDLTDEEAHLYEGGDEWSTSGRLSSDEMKKELAIANNIAKTNDEIIVKKQKQKKIQDEILEISKEEEKLAISGDQGDFAGILSSDEMKKELAIAQELTNETPDLSKSIPDFKNFEELKDYLDKLDLVKLKEEELFELSKKSHAISFNPKDKDNFKDYLNTLDIVNKEIHKRGYEPDNVLAGTWKKSEQTREELAHATEKVIQKDKELAKAEQISTNRLETGFQVMKQKIAELGNFNLSKSYDKEKLSHWVDQYIKYQNQGGTRSIDELVENPKALTKFKKEYASQMENTGKEVVDKLSDGVKESSDKYLNTTNDLMKEGVKTARRAIRAESPAGEYIDISIDAVEGLIKGLEERAPKYYAYIKALMEGGVDEARKALNSTGEINTSSLGEDLSKIASSTVQTSDKDDSLIQKAEALKVLNNILNKLTGKGSDKKVEGLVKSITQIREALSESVDDSSFISAIQKLAEQGDRLKDLAEVLKASKKQVDNAQKTISEPELSQEDMDALSYALSQAEEYEKEQRRILDIEKQIEQARKEGEKQAQVVEAAQAKAAQKEADEREAINKEIDKYIVKIQKIIDSGKYTTDANTVFSGYIKDLSELKNNLNTLDLSQAYESFGKLSDKISNSLRDNELKNYAKAIELNIAKLGNKLADFKSKNSALGKELTLRFKQVQERYLALVNSGKSGNALQKDLVAIDTELKKIEIDAKNAGQAGDSFGKKIIKSLTSANARFIANYFSFNDIIRYARSAFESIHTLDTALVDLKKTTTMTNAGLNEFYSNSVNIAKQMGVTTAEIINQASSWSRLNKTGPLYGNV